MKEEGADMLARHQPQQEPTYWQAIKACPSLRH